MKIMESKRNTSFFLEKYHLSKFEVLHNQNLSLKCLGYAYASKLGFCHLLLKVGFISP